MGYILCILAGLVVGGLVAWLIAFTRVTKDLSAKIEESERRASTAEGRSSALEGTIAELRVQNEKAVGELAEIRNQLAAETSAK
ncbi:MAG TPA: hypothetical protein PLP42_11245 [Acidobacteriota bacterium]|nr:hypothetical protein [Acidobacteriota bacterium]HRT69843.1 hypothetical protein [Syntrophales bacterium]HXK60456.1 hypothetical protein [Acidobacteriota bacterium]